MTVVILPWASRFCLITRDWRLSEENERSCVARVADRRATEGLPALRVQRVQERQRDSLLGAHANGSVFLKLPSAACPGKVPIAIMLYIDATFIKRGISIRPICRKFLSLNGMWYNIRNYILWYDIVCDIVNGREWTSYKILSVCIFGADFGQWDVSTMIVLSCLDLTYGDLLVFCPYSSRQPSQTIISSGNGTGACAWTRLLLRSISFAPRTSTSALQTER